MKCLNLQDYQAETHNYRKGLAYLKKQGHHQSKPNIAFAKNEKKNTQAENNQRPSNQKKKGRMENHRINWFKMAINNHLSIITLNVNGLNAPIKRHRVAEWIKRQKPSICCLQETDLRTKDTYRLKVKWWEKYFMTIGMTGKQELQYSYQKKIDFKTKDIKKDKEGHYLMIKGYIQEEDITIINIYAPNTGTPRYIQQILTDIKGEIDGNTIIVGDFNTPLTSMDRSSRQKTNKAREILKETIEKSDLFDTFRTLHAKKSEYTFFSNAHQTFSRIDHILGHKANLNKFRSIEIISSIFSDHNAMKLEINHGKRNEKKPTTWGLNNMLLKTNGSMRKSRRKLKNTLKKTIMKTQPLKIYGMLRKQCSEGNLQCYRPFSKKKKDPKLTT
uniref:exodeoxyribonuclease III n=1 Tax=Sus scrofa TaxID=9823 RepID=A0A8D0MV91_PIG